MFVLAVAATVLLLLETLPSAIVMAPAVPVTDALR